MIKVYTSTVLDAPADVVWGIVRDFNALPKWTPFVADSRIEQNLPADGIGQGVFQAAFSHLKTMVGR